MENSGEEIIDQLRQKAEVNMFQQRKTRREKVKKFELPCFLITPIQKISNLLSTFSPTARSPKLKICLQVAGNR